MTTFEQTHPGMNIDAFLCVSRQYLSLPQKRSQTVRPALVSFLTSRLQRTHMHTYRKFIQSFLLVAGVSAFAAGPALAERGCGHMGDYQERHGKMLEQHHNALHDALKLTAEQEPAWKKLIDSEQPRAAAQGGQPEDWAKLNAPERAEKMLELAKARQAQMAEHVTALKAFYAVLTPEQQKSFEDFHAAAHRGMAGRPGPKMASPDQAPLKP